MGLYKEWVHKLPEEKEIMESLTDITDEFVEMIKITHPQKYSKLMERIEELNNINHFNEETLHESREHVPAHYSLETTTNAASEKFEIDFSKECFNKFDFNFMVNEMYKVFHSMYQDEDQKYMELAITWLDIHKGQALKYYRIYQ